MLLLQLKCNTMEFVSSGVDWVVSFITPTIVYIYIRIIEMLSAGGDIALLQYITVRMSYT